jgi:hypothetical protein
MIADAASTPMASLCIVVSPLEVLSAKQRANRELVQSTILNGH